MKPIALTESEWFAVRDKLVSRYAASPSTLLIRDKMKRELGFTVRNHKGWTPEMVSEITIFYLDFYSDEAETMFRLTYL
jgi:aminoglycoside/choline kinase family phosphotransferase